MTAMRQRRPDLQFPLAASQPSTSTPKPVPGTYGPPVLGRVFDTLGFLYFSGWEQFFLNKQRKYQSSVFRANMFLKMTVALDHCAISHLFQSEHLVQDYGFGWAAPPRALVGDVTPSIFEAGSAHDQPKALYLQLLHTRASSLLPVFNRLTDEFIGRWVAEGKIGFRDELEDFSASLLFEWFLGERPNPGDVRLVYTNIFTQLFVGITRLIPWSNYSRSVAAYGRILSFVKNTKAFPEIVALARGHGLTDQDALAKQITFLLGMNSFLGIQALTKAVAGELSLRPELRDSLRREMEAAMGASRSLSSLAALGAMPMLDKTLREILRLHPPVTFVFGRATQDLNLESESGTFILAKGELLMGVLPVAQKNESVFPQPEQFDPGRFENPVASQHLIWPRGLHEAQVTSHDRTCPGKDYAIIIAKLFCCAGWTGKWKRRPSGRGRGSFPMWAPRLAP